MSIGFGGKTRLAYTVFFIIHTSLLIITILYKSLL